MEKYETGELKTYNASQEIAKHRDLPLILFHEDMMLQARTGKAPGVNIDDITDNQRKMNQVRALTRIISAQKQLINISRAQIKFRAVNKWQKRQQPLEEAEKTPFEEDENDYNKLMYLKELLDACEKDIINADLTPSLEDDYILEKEGEDGKYYELTQNFYEMITELENTWEEIHLLMLTNKIISSGIEIDEEYSYKEQEEEVIRRITEA